ncbi:uncharacterized protein LOC111330593 isoform X1 [Stylophora pistillata]|uniref:Transmembrane protein C15orf27 n=1 Tax=Stylophora pistillata TaxID=50429 RepID=A0A2B4S860_STYPI|nr:uncharacterized protein LOC111330593 isoform X1 [Stylophora pistillata]XP_022791203.1 uncharacterized protein LOC111330593 isoform X1 [Stylophora pistillata]XP_022791204.1 uncharacterized protein LOC111330593 isoform X1 [Stylophora pistillata]PFX25269.1 Transmembrane protein C15orf27 [Stylophora pistillata]
MESVDQYTASSDSEELSLDNFTLQRLASANTETEDTSDGSDEDCRSTRRESGDRREISPEKHRDKNKIKSDFSKEAWNKTHIPGDSNESPKPVTSDTTHSLRVLPSGETETSASARAYSPEEDSELFSTEYVDKLVASFWNKVDQKIEAAVSNYQASPQAGQQTNLENSAPTDDAKANDAKTNDKSTTKYSGGVCVFILFIFQFLAKIWVICKEEIKNKWKERFTDEMGQHNLKAIITHRHANFTVVMVTLVDCFLVIVNILADFDVIDDNGIEFIFNGFLYINLVIMFLFVLECLIRMAVLKKELFQDKMEMFDAALVYFYFLVELITSNCLSEVGNPYPKYLHMIVILRCWRILLVLEQLQLEKELELSAIESQTQR